MAFATFGKFFAEIALQPERDSRTWREDPAGDQTGDIAMDKAAQEKENQGRTILFSGMDGAEIEEALAALDAREKSYPKDEIILRAGEITRRMGLILDGSVTIENNDVSGERTILSHAGEGEFFAETYALLPDEVMLVDVRANEDCRILFLDISGISAGAAQGPVARHSRWREKMTLNLLLICARKNLVLSERNFITSAKGIRGKVTAYLNSVSLRGHSDSFDIPFDRQQLADYLNADRTSLSKELGKMSREGLIKCRRNHFTLLKRD